MKRSTPGLVVKPREIQSLRARLGLTFASFDIPNEGLLPR
jgi:hypothetical protein